MELKKPYIFQEQLKLLKSRGCIVSDETNAISILERVNYYRLSAYFLPFKKLNGNYKDGTTLEKIYEIYEFDRKLRRILFTAIEDIEVSFRARIAYFHAHKYGAEGYINSSNFSYRHNHNKFIENLDREIEHNNKVLFVVHHKENYDGKFPIWVATELFTFGMISKFYSDLSTQDQKQIAKEFYRSVPKHLISCLRCCTDLRNICAHYGRLYFRVFTAMPDIQNLSDKEKRSLWGAVLATKSIYQSDEKWKSEITPAIINLFAEYQDVILLNHIGFPTDWKNKI